MRSLLVHPLTRIWLLLAVLTALAWGVATGGSGVPASGSRMLAAALMVLAFVKVRLVILRFMEIRNAPKAIRFVLEAWVVVVCATIIAIYWNGASAS